MFDKARIRKELKTEINQLASRGINKENGTYSERLEKPLVLAICVTILKQFLNVLLSILPLCRLLERISGHRILETFQLDSVSCREKMRVIDSL